MACRQVDDKQSLQGKWRFALDPNDLGLTEQWYNKSLNDTIHLPGSLQEQGYGDNVGIETPWTGQIVDRSWYDAPQYEKFRQPGNIKVPFWLNPDKHYVGVAWYQKEVEIPASWNGRPVELELERTGKRRSFWMAWKWGNTNHCPLRTDTLLMNCPPENTR